MVLLSLITATAVVSKILDHLHLPSTPPPLAPARLPSRQADLLALSFEPDEPTDDQDFQDFSHDTPTSVDSRAPPSPSRAHRG